MGGLCQGRPAFGTAFNYMVEKIPIGTLMMSMRSLPRAAGPSQSPLCLYEVCVNATATVSYFLHKPTCNNS